MNLTLGKLHDRQAAIERQSLRTKYVKEESNPYHRADEYVFYGGTIRNGKETFDFQKNNELEGTNHNLPVPLIAEIAEAVIFENPLLAMTHNATVYRLSQDV